MESIEEKTTALEREEEEEDEEEEDMLEDGGEEKEEEDDEEEEEDNDNDDGGGDASQAKPLRKQKIVGTSCPGRKCVPGIIYVGHIPPRLRPKHVRNMLSIYGEIGRIFLQPEDRLVKKKKKKAGSRGSGFTEGWVEFRDKRIAKRVAASLHNTPMGAKKHHRFHSDLWCLKYLHRFHWTHLSERLAYEQTAMKQRLRTEVSQAKKESSFFLNNLEQSHRLDVLRKRREKQGEEVEDRKWDFTQRPTEEEIQMRKMKKQKVSQKHLDKARLIQQKSQSNVSLLTKIFNSSKSQE
ncbi:activator of basal transcription 1 isoform 1-T2 [Polymixia lowei]